MDKKYGVALIGAGARGGAYSRIWSQIEEAELVAVCDIIEERAKDYLEEYGYNKMFLDYKQAIDQEEVDIVTVCTPAAIHPEIGNYAMEKGKHVLSEKPMGLSFKKCEKMIKVSQEQEVALAFGLQYRNREDYRKFKHVFQENLMERPVMAIYNDIRSIRTVVGKPAMHDGEDGNGGPLVDMFCHINDLMRWFTGADPVSVMARDFTFSESISDLKTIKNLAPDTGSIIVEYESGDILNINLCWGLKPDVGNSKAGGIFEIMGADGFIGDKVEKVTLPDTEKKEVEQADELTVVNYFLQAIKGEGEVQASGEDALVTLATSLAAVKSAKTGETVKVREIYHEKPSLIDLL